MLVSRWKWKTRKIIIPSSVPPILWIVSVCQGKSDRKKKKERKKTDRTQTKLNAPHVMHNIKILP